MSKPFPTLFGRATAVLDEHMTLRTTLGQLREYCARLVHVGRRIEPEPASVINYFLQQLRAHFAAEEADGYFGTLAASGPNARDHVVALRAEHKEMLATAESLRVLAVHSHDSLNLAAALSKLLDLFDRHERRETELLREFLQHD
jgi:hypothetical protein